MVEIVAFWGFLRWWALAMEVKASCVSLWNGSECGIVLKSEMGIVLLIGVAEFEGEREYKTKMNTMYDEGKAIVFRGSDVQMMERL